VHTSTRWPRLEPTGQRQGTKPVSTRVRPVAATTTDDIIAVSTSRETLALLK
jgi:hypothetical protein